MRRPFIRNRTYRRLFWWVLIPFSVAVLVFLIFLGALLHPVHLKQMALDKLSEHLNLDADMTDLSVSFFPRPRISGTGLTLRLPNRPELPPFISIQYFSAEVGLLSIVRKHVAVVQVAGLVISVPPGGLGSVEAFKDSAPAAAPAASDPANPSGGSKRASRSDIIVDHLVSHDAELRFVPRKPNANPLVFQVHDLRVDDVGFERKMPYVAKLTNPVPLGLVDATGNVGPWNKDDATLTPLDGKYTFSDAQLGTINGIGGKLDSTGTFTGQLTEIKATGEARIPDFSLDLGGRPAPLTATFEAVVDGTDGTTILKRVDAKMRRTPMKVSGSIVNLPGPAGHRIDLDVRIAAGRIEDLLALCITSPKPIMTGRVALHTKLLLPAGKARTRDRIRLDGTFGLSDTTFTDPLVQGKIQELSRRSQGKAKKKDDANDPDEPTTERTLSSLKGRFSIANGILSLPDLGFQVPGADIDLGGTYALADGTMDFHGTLKMEATVSKAMGGFKSIFLKPFDALFRKNGVGAVIPIKISGTRDEPKFGLEMGKVMKGGTQPAKPAASKLPAVASPPPAKSSQAKPPAKPAAPGGAQPKSAQPKSAPKSAQPR